MIKKYSIITKCGDRTLLHFHELIHLYEIDDYMKKIKENKIY